MFSSYILILIQQMNSLNKAKTERTKTYINFRPKSRTTNSSPQNMISRQLKQEMIDQALIMIKNAKICINQELPKKVKTQPSVYRDRKINSQRQKSRMNRHDRKHSLDNNFKRNSSKLVEQKIPDDQRGYLVFEKDVNLKAMLQMRIKHIQQQNKKLKNPYYKIHIGRGPNLKDTKDKNDEVKKNIQPPSYRNVMKIKQNLKKRKILCRNKNSDNDLQISTNSMGNNIANTNTMGNNSLMQSHKSVEENLCSSKKQIPTGDKIQKESENKFGFQYPIKNQLEQQEKQRVQNRDRSGTLKYYDIKQYFQTKYNQK